MNFRLKRLADEKSKSDKGKDKKEDIDMEDLGPPEELLDFGEDEKEDVEIKDEGNSQDNSVEEDEELGEVLDDRDSEDEENKESEEIPDDLRGSLEDQINTTTIPSSTESSLPSDMASQEESQTKQIADKGRDSVEKIEEYKFFVDQMSKNMKANPALADAVKEKEKDLEQASQKIYDVVYEMENMDVMKQYENPLIGIPNEEPDEGSYGSEPTNFTDDEEDSFDSGENTDSSFPNVPQTDSPNDLLDMFGEDGFSDLMSGEPPIEEEEEEEEELDLPPPKQTKVEPKGKPKK